MVCSTAEGELGSNNPRGNKGQASQVQQKTSHTESQSGFGNGFRSAHQKAGTKAQTKPKRRILPHEEWHLIAMQGGIPCTKPLPARGASVPMLPKPMAALAQSTACLEITQPITTALASSLGKGESCETEGPHHCSSMRLETSSRNAPPQWRGRARQCSFCREGAGSGSFHRGDSRCRWAPLQAA